MGIGQPILILTDERKGTVMGDRPQRDAVVTLCEPVSCTDGSLAPAGTVGTVLGPGAYGSNTVDVALLDGRVAWSLISRQYCEDEAR